MYAGDGTTQYFALPADFYQLVNAKAVIGTTRSLELRKYGELEEAALESVPAGSAFAAPAYRLQGAQIRVLPPMSVGQTLSIKYIPVAVRLASAGDPFDGYNGWEEFVILDAARKVATKQRLWDLVAQLKGDIAKIEARIAALAGKRDRGRAEHVQDSRAARRYARFAWWRSG
jgi:hypothetical protein